MPSNGHTRGVLRSVDGLRTGLGRFDGLSREVSAIVVATALVATAGCSRMGQLKAMKNFKEANTAYQQQDYKKAAELYEATVQADPTLASAYFYLGNSYDNLYKPSKKGEPANDQLLEKAVQNYQTAA